MTREDEEKHPYHNNEIRSVRDSLFSSSNVRVYIVRGFAKKIGGLGQNRMST